MSTALDLDLLLKLRVVVARYGEMDVARWWNTKGQLGRVGTLALRRGFPRTHHFAQARSVFAVARHRCAELFEPPGCVTLWSLPASVEEDFDAHWERWLDQAAEWEPFFGKIEGLTASGLDQILRALELVSDAEIAATKRLSTSAEGRAVALPGTFGGADADLRQLALAFSQGAPGAPAVPYARVG